MTITFFKLSVRARAVVTVIRRPTTPPCFTHEDLTEDSLTAPRKEFSTGPPQWYRDAYGYEHIPIGRPYDYGYELLH